MENGSFLQIMCLLLGEVLANYEEKTVIGEATGISLEKEGFLLDRIPIPESS